MFPRLAETGISESKPKLSLEGNPAPDSRVVGPASSWLPGFSWPRPAWIQRVLEVRDELTLIPLPSASTMEAKPRVLAGLAKARGG